MNRIIKYNVFICLMLVCSVAIAADSMWQECLSAFDIINSLWGILVIFGTTVMFIAAICKRKLIKSIIYVIEDFFHGKYAIQELVSKHLILGELLFELRSKVRVLVVDDDTITRESIVEQLKGLGYNKTVGHFPIMVHDDEVKECQILVIDINKVYFGHNPPLGNENQGLEVAQTIKYAYPVKKILSVTGNLEDYKGNAILEKVVDGKFEKGDDQSVIVQKIDKCIKELFEPDKFWIQIRNELLDSGEKIEDVCRLEDVFVKAFIREDSITLENLKYALDKISAKSSLAKAMARIIASIG